MRICIKHTRPGASEHYVEARLAEWFKGSREEGRGPVEVGAHVARLAATAKAAMEESPLPIARAEDFPAVTSEQESRIEERKRCALEDVERASPLQPGEIVAEDFFSYLVEPVGDISPGTPVLRRRTNFAELYYIFDGVEIRAGEAVFKAVIPPEVTPVTVAPLTGTPSIAVDIGKSLAIALLKWVGSTIIEEIFPPQVPTYFDKVYAEIGKIVSRALTTQTIEEINGAINGKVRWLRDAYTPIREKEDRRELLRLLRDQSRELYDKVATLMLERYAMEGLPVFIVAAGLHLTMLQEEALVQSRTSGDGRKLLAENSIAAGTIQDYAGHLEETFPKLVAARGNAVTVVTARHDKCVPTSRGIVCFRSEDGHRWKDTVTGEVGSEFLDYVDGKKIVSRKANAEADRKKRVAAVVARLDDDLGNPQDIAAKWRQLLTAP